MIVYRIENDKGIGPLLARNGEGLETRHHDEPDSMVGVRHGRSIARHMIPGYLYSGAFYFAWDSIENLAGFLTSPRTTIINSNHRVIIYEINQDDCITFPDGQVMFIMEQATAIGGFCYTDHEAWDLISQYY